MRGRIISTMVAAWMVATGAQASSIDEPICTDRPGKGSSTCAAPAGHWQFETGLADWSVTKSRGERHTDLTLGSTAIKYGIAEGLHLELLVEPLVIKTKRTADGRDRDSGIGDLHVKLKQELATGSEAFSAALYPYVKLPTASRRIGNGKVEGGLVVPLSLDLGASPFSLSTSPEVALSADGAGHGYHPYTAHNLSLGYTASDRLSLAAELWGSWDFDEGGTTREATVGGNAAYRLNRNLQIDGEIDFGLTRDTADVEISGGVSVRF